MFSCVSIGANRGQFPAELKVQNAQKLLGIYRLDEQRRQFWRGQIVHLVLNLVERHARKKNDRQRPPMFLHVSEHRKSVDAGHMQVKQDRIHLSMLQLQNCGIPVPRLIDIVARSAQILRQRQSLDGRVITQKNSMTVSGSFGDHTITMQEAYFVPFRCPFQLEIPPNYNFTFA